MAALYSTELIAFTVSSGVPATFLVGLGTIVIVRDISGFVDAPTGSVDNAAVVDVDGLVIAEWQVPDRWADQVHWEGRRVCNAGSLVTASVGGTPGPSFEVCVTGYVLTAP